MVDVGDADSRGLLISPSHAHVVELKFEQNIPEVEKSLEITNHLKTKKENDELVITRYNLCDAVYAKAQVDTDAGIVMLWLGANVMLGYTYDDAIELLTSKLERAKVGLKDVTEDLGFVRNQIITSEVCISRIYNWDIKRRRKQVMDKL